MDLSLLEGKLKCWRWELLKRPWPEPEGIVKEERQSGDWAF